MTMQPWSQTETAVQQPQQSTIRRDLDSWIGVVPDMSQLANVIHGTEMVSPGLRGSAPKTLAAMLFAREVGLPLMAGLGSIDVIHGRASMSAEAKRALIRGHGHQMVVTEMSADRCIVKGKRHDDPDQQWVTASYTMAEAVKAGDAAKNPNYKTRPAEMLLARATGRLAKMHFSDVVLGLATSEEVYDEAPVAPAVASVAAVEVQEDPAPEEKPRAIGRKPAPEKKPRETAQAAPPPAKRPPLRKAPAPTEPADSPAAAIDTLPEAEPDEDGVIEAEVVPEQPAQDADEAPAWQAKGLKVIHMHWGRLEVKERPEQLYYVAEITGRKVESHKDLSQEELRTLAAQLERVKDLKALNAALDAKRQAGDARE